MSSEIQFPVSALPAQAAHARLVGLYPQRRAGLWMQRVRVPGGRLTGAQWHGLAEVARRLTPGDALHLTTRQDVEIHGLCEQAVPQAQRLLAKAGLTGLGSGGDTIRNVTVCPCSGVLTGAPELWPLAKNLSDLLQSQHGAFSLPRKLKISLSACPDGCGQPWINDLGLTAERQGDGWAFRAVLAGSLGARPGTGIAFGRLLEPQEVLPLALAALRVFAAHGDRCNRHKARLRHVRERVGDEAFLQLIGEAFAQAKGEGNWPGVALAQPARAFDARAVLTFANGDVTPAMAESLAHLAGDERLRVRIANQHRLIVFAQDRKALESALAVAEPLAEAARPQTAVVACPGTRWCSRALVDTNVLAGRIRQALAAKAVPAATICISGCPNGCAHSAVADIGLSGCVAVSTAGDRQEAFDLTVGGGMGRDGRLGRLAKRKLAPDQALQEVLAVVRRNAGDGGN